MPYVAFVKRNIRIGNKVKFDTGTFVAIDVKFGNNILIAANVSFDNKIDHDYTEPAVLMWNAARIEDEMTIIEDDVWIGNNVTVIAGITIGRGSIVAAGALVNKDVPACEIWGGVPTKKIKDRFNNIQDQIKHLEFLNISNIQK